MGVLDIVRLVIFRMHEKGLEIFLINNEMENDPDVWKLPEQSKNDLEMRLAELKKESIELGEESSFLKNGVKTLAIEGDWHEIPSIKGMLRHDLKIAKKIIKHNLPNAEKGTFVAAKECFKKLLPEEYEAVKELKEIILDRNAVKNI
jgi:hypothetical protein